MRIYFAGSIRGGAWNKENYLILVNHMKKFGVVLTEHIPHTDEMDVSEYSDREIYDQDMAWIRSADVFVAEVSSPSLGVGYEIGKAEQYGVPVLCLFQVESNRRLSAMIEGNLNCTVKRYSRVEDALDYVTDFIHMHIDILET